jgi:hypothetical protein
MPDPGRRPAPEAVGPVEVAREALIEGAGPFFDAIGPNQIQGDNEIIAGSDATVSAANRTTNFGLDTTMTAASPAGTPPNGTVSRVFVRFLVENYTSAPGPAHIFLWVQDNATDQGGPQNTLTVSRGSDAWDEGLITFANQPGSGAIIQTIPFASHPANAWLEIDVSSWVKGNGVYTFVISSSSGATRFRSNQFWGNGPTFNRQCFDGNAWWPCVSLYIWGTGTNNRNVPRFACPTLTQQGSLGNLPTSPALDQVSGFIASTKFPNTFYALNDRSADAATAGRVFTLTPGAASPSATSSLPASSTTRDTEEIQIGPGPTAEKSYIYVGDIGDNGRSRTAGSNPLRLYRAPEPAAATDSIPTSAWQTLFIQYPGGMKLNSEAFVIDPVTGALTILEKPCGANADGTILGVNRIFQLGSPLPFNAAAGQPGSSGNPAVLEEIGAIDMRLDAGTDSDTSCSQQVTNVAKRSTGMAITPRTGNAVAVTFYNQTKFWWRATGYLDLSFLAYNDPSTGFHCDLNTRSATDDPKREAISFGANGRNLVTTGEGSRHAIWPYAQAFAQ